jgi:hypothetical protein
MASTTALAHVIAVKQEQMLSARAARSPGGVLPDEVIRAEDPTRLNEARRLLDRAVTGQFRRLGPAHPQTLETLDTLGGVLYHLGDFAGAESVLRGVADDRRRVFGPSHPATLQSLKLWAGSLRRLGRAAEATPIFLEVAEGHRQTFGATHIQTSSALGHLFLSYERTGDWAAMGAFCERWLREILDSPVDHDPYQRLRRSITLDKLTLHLGALPGTIPFDAELAVRAAGEAMSLREGWYGHVVFGAVHHRAGHDDEALIALRLAERQRDWTGGNDLYWFVLASAHARRGDTASAVKCLEKGRNPETKRDTWSDIVSYFRAEAEAMVGTRPVAESSPE